MHRYRERLVTRTKRPEYSLKVILRALYPFAQKLLEVAPDRAIWGTDFPHPNISGDMPNDGDLVDLLALFAPDATLRQKILVDNPARLYGFED